MPQAFRNPMVWAAALLIAVAIGVLVVGSTDDQPELQDAATLSATISDLQDGVGGLGAERTSTASDITDGALLDLSGIPVFDERERCAWLVGVPGTDSGIIRCTCRRSAVLWSDATSCFCSLALVFLVIFSTPPFSPRVCGQRSNCRDRIRHRAYACCR